MHGKTCMQYKACVEYNSIYDALSDLVPFAQFKNREKHPWRIVTFSKAAGFMLKVTLLHGCFSRFLNCTNGAKSQKASHMEMERDKPGKRRICQTV